MATRARNLMSSNGLRGSRKVRLARRGSKRGWVYVTGQVPPELVPDLERVEAKLEAVRSDVIHLALAAFVKRELKRAA